MDRGLILVAEDERTARLALTDLLESQGFTVISADNGRDALSLVLSNGPAVSLFDIRMPLLGGLAVLERARQSASTTAFLMMTAYGDSTTTIEAMKRGAFDFVAKPVNFDQLVPLLRRAVAHCRITKQQRLESAPAAPGPAFVGYSPEMQNVYKLIGQVAGTGVNVLVRGESGTGKELVANAIHHNSPRSSGPPVKVNCAAISGSAARERAVRARARGLHECHLPAHRPLRAGAPRDAVPGRDLGASLQSKLLRCIQDAPSPGWAATSRSKSTYGW